jgi:DNA-binding CsgD family transcriptional regulator
MLTESERMGDAPDLTDDSEPDDTGPDQIRIDTGQIRLDTDQIRLDTGQIRPDADQMRPGETQMEHVDADVGARLDTAVAARDWDEVQSLVGRHWAPLVADHPVSLRAAIAALPDDVVAANPRWISAQNYLNYLPIDGAPQPVRFRDSAPPSRSVSLIDALVELTSRSAAARSQGQFERAAHWVDEAREVLADATEEAHVEIRFSLPDLHFQWGKTREFLGQFPQALEEYQDAHDLAMLTGNHLMYTNALGSLAWLHMLMGRTDEGMWWIDHIPGDVPTASHTARFSLTASLARILAHIDRLEYDEALAALRDEVDVQNPQEYWADVLYLKSLVSHATHDPWRLLSDIDAAIASRPPEMSTGGMNAVLLSAARSDLYLALEQPARARQILRDTAVTRVGIFLRLNQAKIELLAGDMSAVARLVEPLLGGVTAEPRSLAEALVLTSVVHLRAGRATEATDAFTQAFGIVAQRTFLAALMVVPRDDFEHLAALAGDAIDQELAASVLERGSFLSIPASFAPLSPRERSVLTELVSGASIAEIAARLFVSQNTVKSQLRSAYRKLGVANRAEAEAAVVRYGLVD